VQIAAELVVLVPEFGLVVLVLRAVRTVTGTPGHLFNALASSNQCTNVLNMKVLPNKAGISFI
jgi:hypothetical protein